MARKAKKRTKFVRLSLTAEAFKLVEESAFRNCRSVSQELTYMVERQLVGKRETVPVLTYDAPAYDAQPYDAPAPEAEPVLAPSIPTPDGPWRPDDEARVAEAAKSSGLSEAQLTAIRLLNKTPEAVLAAIHAEGVPA